MNTTILPALIALLVATLTSCSTPDNPRNLVWDDYSRSYVKATPPPYNQTNQGGRYSSSASGQIGTNTAYWRRESHPPNQQYSRASSTRPNDNNETGRALGKLLLKSFFYGPSGGGRSGSRDEGSPCQNCGTPTTNFSGYCDRCGPIIMEQQSRRTMDRYP